MSIPLKREIAAAVDDGVSRAGTRDGSYDGPRELAQDATQTTWDVGQGGFAGLESKHVELSDQDVSNIVLRWPPRDDFEAYRVMDLFMTGEIASGAAQGFGLDVGLRARRLNESEWSGGLSLGTVKVGSQGFSTFTLTSYQYDGATEVPFSAGSRECFWNPTRRLDFARSCGISNREQPTIIASESVRCPRPSVTRFLGDYVRTVRPN